MKDALTKLFSDLLTYKQYAQLVPIITRPENPDHGEYTTNVAMMLTKFLKQNPMDIAAEIKKTLMLWMQSDENKKQYPILTAVDHIDIVSPGFINIFLNNESLKQNLTNTKKQTLSLSQTIMVEYAQPNTHKVFHIGHLRNIITGECIVRLLQASGHTVIRANYQGDVGLHIAKALYGILQITDDKLWMTELATISDKVVFLADAYIAGNKAYEETEEGKEKINHINKQIYAKDPDIYPLYEKTRQWSLEYFDTMYKRLGTKFDRLYFESESYEVGKKLVTDSVKKGVFEKSEGAIIFPGEKYGLHNRVFITSEGNPTYEGKDIGLAKLQFEDYHPDRIIHCVSTEQIEYFRVIFEAIAQVFPDTRGKEYHLPYGFVQLKHGKMSSRSGNVIGCEWLLNEVKKEIQTIMQEEDRGYEQQEKETIAEIATIAAVKYAFLKVGTAQEIAFDIKESINTNGDSGPYLLYTYARCKSVMKKSHQKGDKGQKPTDKKTTLLNQEEHDLARLLLYVPEIVQEAGEKFAPNTLCSYLFTIAQTFNLMYAKHPIIGNDLRMKLTEKTAQTIQKGLYFLGIETVERM